MGEKFGRVRGWLRRGWRVACWAAAPRPSKRQLRCLVLLGVLLSLGVLRVLARPYPALTPVLAWDDYHILRGLDEGHELRDAVGYFAGDWPERNGFYRPLTGVSLWLDYRLWRWQPYGYRLTNFVIYALTAAMFTLFVALVTGRRAYAVAALLFFTLWPQQGSQAALAVLNTRGELLCGLCMLAGLYTALRFVVDAQGRWLALALLALVGALLSKEMGLSLPLLLLPCALPVIAAHRGPGWPLVVRAALVAGLWGSLVVGWIYLYHAVLGGRMPLPGQPMPAVMSSTPLLITGAFLPDLTVLLLYLRSEKALTDVFAPWVRVAAARLVLWLAALVCLGRREPWLLVLYLLWTPLSWVPLRSVHAIANHYLYLPQMNRYLALGVLAVLLAEALARDQQPQRVLAGLRTWLARQFTNTPSPG